MRSGALLVLCLTLGAAVADLPINCLFSDAVGTWLVTETDRTGDSSLACSQMGEIVYNKKFTLAFPNTVTDEQGFTGTWTMIYNQGFEVTINERSYWANFDYNSTHYNCERLYTGWSRDVTARNWGCFTGVKEGTDGSSYEEFNSIDYSEDRYRSDFALIEAINKKQNSWTARAYPEHEQYTVKEMILRAGGHYHDLPNPAPATADQKARIDVLPTNFDWRNISGVNYVSDVRDQGSCGSCYAFASAGMTEARLRLNTKNLRSDVFSVQDVLDCSLLSEACSGGFPLLIAGRYAMDQGFINENCNTYIGIEGFTCTRDEQCSRTYVSDYEYVGGYYGACNEEAMMLELVNNGPVTVDFNVFSDFYNYESGIYHHTASKTDFNPLYIVNHAVLLVGYGVEEATGEKFWTVKNSWGDGWGEQGYFRIRRSTNECGIESAAVRNTVIP